MIPGCMTRISPERHKHQVTLRWYDSNTTKLLFGSMLVYLAFQDFYYKVMVTLSDKHCCVHALHIFHTVKDVLPVPLSEGSAM